MFQFRYGIITMRDKLSRGYIPSNSAGGEKKMAVGGYMGGIFGSSPVSPLQKHMSKVYACASELVPLFNAVINEDRDEVARLQKVISGLEKEADVLKKELLFDPCLDIVGNRLPNYFVERSGVNSDQARAGVAAMMKDIGADEGALIYPEGTRFSRRKHDALKRRAGNSPEQLRQLTRWPNLLPPRLGGTLAMLNANPGKDVLFCAHVGFEGSSHFSNLVNGSWLSAQIKIQFWRVPFNEIPRHPDALQSWLFRQWDRMHDWVTANQSPQPQIQQSEG